MKEKICKALQRVRIQKIIAAYGYCSRRKAELLLIENRVKVNGDVAKIGDKTDPNIDKILIDDIPLIKRPEIKTLLVNKPVGVISSCIDPSGRKTVIDLVPEFLRQGLHPIGRLDFNSRGAILLTNFGELTLQLTHPKYSHLKTYEVWVKGLPKEKTLSKWREGILLEQNMTREANIIKIKDNRVNTLLSVGLREGRNRQIRRVAEILGHPVLDLKRISIGGIDIKGLKEGDWRFIKSSELELLFNETKTIKK
tara:strand:- start:545 stop:1303 length:759 start_codon:yes stop_codon:yes gene_type:complete